MPVNCEETGQNAESIGDRKDSLSPAKLTVGAFVALITIGATCFTVLADAVQAESPEPVAAMDETPTPLPTPVATTTATSSATSKPTATLTPKPSSKPTATAKAMASATPKTTNKAQPPKNAKKCGDSSKFTAFAGNESTSCPFVTNVAKVMDSKAQEKKEVKVKASSDTTGKTYNVTCSPGKADAFTCKGGNNGVIYLIPK